MTPILRLTQFTEAENRYCVEVALEGDGQPRQTATSHFAFKLSPQDHEDLRWYLEDYLQYPLDPAPKIAARIEQRMNEIGTNLFKSVFQSSDDARDLWATLRGQLNDARVERTPSYFKGDIYLKMIMLLSLCLFGQSGAKLFGKRFGAR